MITSIFTLLTVFLIFLPLQPFLVTWSNNALFSYLRDIFVLVFFLLAFFQRLKTQKPLIADFIEWLILVFGLIFIFSGLFISRSEVATIFSLRYSFQFFVLFWSIRTFFFTDSQSKILIKVFSAIIIVLTALSLIHAYLLPRDFLLQFGYSSVVSIGNGIWQSGAKLPALQEIPGSIARTQGTLSGPVQLGIYCLVLLGLVISDGKKFINKKVANWLSALLILLLFTNFTRSAWLGFLVMMIFYSWQKWHLEQKITFRIKGIILAILLIFTISYLILPSLQERINNSIFRPQSSSEHKQSIARVFQQIDQIGFWGRGAGLSGPASFRFNQAESKAVENSYLRTYEELGVFGFIIFITLILILLQRLLANKYQAKVTTEVFRFAAGLSLLGITVAMLFNDSWTEGIPLLTLAIITGFGLPLTKNNEPRRVSILDINLDSLTLEQTREKINQMIIEKKPHQICTINSEFLLNAYTDSQFKKILQNSSLNTADGFGVIAAGEYNSYQFFPSLAKFKWLYPLYYLISSIYFFLLGIFAGLRLIFAARSFELIPQRVTGADLVNELCLHSKKSNYQIFFLGGKDSQDRPTETKLKQKFPGLKIAGLELGNKVKADGEPEDLNLVKRIQESKADILLVGWGSPKQELFISKFKKELNIPVMIGVGGSIDYLLDIQKRAPKIIQILALEWLWRLLLEPKRLKRIYKAVIIFPWIIFRLKLDSKFDKTR